MKTASLTRRQFLGTTGAVGVGVILAPSLRAHEPALLRVGLVGLGRRGMEHLSACLSIGHIEIAALCDADPKRLRTALGLLRQAGRAIPGSYRDPFNLAQSGDVSAVVIATPDDTHALLTSFACKAGLDAMVEPPLGTSPQEGMALLHAVQCSRRIVHVCQAVGPLPSPGFLRRSYEPLLGPLTSVRVTCTRPARGQGALTRETLDWIDYARTGLGVQEPCKVLSAANRVRFEYAGTETHLEVEQMARNDRRPLLSVRGARGELERTLEVPTQALALSWAAFYAAVTSRQPVADLGHLAAADCHAFLASRSLEEGRAIRSSQV